MHPNKNNFLKFGSVVLLMIALLVALGLGVFPILRGNKNAGAAAVTPFDLGWKYARPIPVDYPNTASNLAEFQVKISVNTGAFFHDAKIRSDCADLRFTDENNSPLYYYFFGGACDTSSPTAVTDVWVKINTIPAGGTAIRMYYGNPTAAADYQNLAEVFSYKEPRPVGYILNEREKKVQIVSLADKNTLVVDNAPQSVSSGETVTAQHGGVIKASKLISIDETSGGAVVPFSWAGIEFEVTADINKQISFLLVALFGESLVEISNSSGCTVLSPVTVSSAVKLIKCTSSASPISIKSTNAKPFLAAFKVENETEYRPMYPKTAEQLYTIDISSQEPNGQNWATPLPVSAFGTLFGSSVDTEYVGALSFNSMICTLKDHQSESGPADTLSFSSVTGPEFFTEIEGKWNMRCDGSPAYAVFKAKDGHAKNVWSEPFMRQFSSPMPQVEEPGEEIAPPAPKVPVPAPEHPEVTCPDTYVPSNKNQYVNASNRLGWWYNQQFDEGDELISQYTYNVYLAPEQWFIDSAVSPDDPATWADPTFQQEHLVCFAQPHEVSYGPGLNVYVDIPQQCFPIDYAQASLVTAPPTLDQLAYIHLTKTQITDFIHAVQTADDLDIFLQPFVDANPIFNGSGVNLTDGAGVTFQEGESDGLGNIILTVQDEIPGQILHIPIEKKLLENLLHNPSYPEVGSIASAHLAEIDLTPFQLNDLYINELTSGKLKLSDPQLAAWNKLKELQSKAIAANANYYWKIGVTALNSTEIPTTVLCPQASTNSFHTISLSEIEQSRTVSEPTEQFIYDGRVIANPPPGFIDTFSDLPIFQQSRGR